MRPSASLENVEAVDVDFKAQKATVTMKDGDLDKGVVLAAFEGTRYGVTTFKAPKGVKKAVPSKWLVEVTGMT